MISSTSSNREDKRQRRRRQALNAPKLSRSAISKTTGNFVKNSSPILVVVCFLLLLAAVAPSEAWIAPSITPRSRPSATVREYCPSNTPRRTSRPFSSTLLSATLEEHKSSEEDKVNLPPRRTRRVDDILSDYEETGDAGLTISILESSLKREQEKSSTLAVRLEYAERIIAEQKKTLEDKRSTLQKKSQALSETQKKLRELEQRLEQKGMAPPRAAPPPQQLPPPANPQAPWQQPPLTNSERQYPLITNWSINRNTGEVTGSVSCHPSIPDGTTIVTSGLEPISFALTGDNFVYRADLPAMVVTTKSGSMYQLGVKKVRLQQSIPASYQQPPPPSQPQENKLHPSNQIYPNLDYPLTGQSISNGRGTKYLLAGSPKRKPSGRCEIIMAYKCDDRMQVCDTETVYVVKLSTYKEKLSREFENYRQVQDTGKGGGWIGGAISNMFPLDQSSEQGTDSNEQPFVKCFDFLPICEGSLKYAQHSAIVLEKGHEDLRDFEFHLQEEDPEDLSVVTSMDPPVLGAALLAAANGLQMLHSRAKLVWTDLKAENLIFMTPQDPSSSTVVSIKGVDLESAIPHRGNPLDYTPEACPPEFAKFHLEGNPYDFVVDYSYDVWSFGMLAYELATGRAYFRGKSADEIMQLLGNPSFQVPLDTPEARPIQDPQLEDLIRSCLQLDPRRRISVPSILRHPYLQDAKLRQQGQQQQQSRASGGGGGSEGGGVFGSGGGTFW